MKRRFWIGWAIGLLAAAATTGRGADAVVEKEGACPRSSTEVQLPTESPESLSLHLLQAGNAEIFIPVQIFVARAGVNNLLEGCRFDVAKGETYTTGIAVLVAENTGSSPLELAAWTDDSKWKIVLLQRNGMFESSLAPVKGGSRIEEFKMSPMVLLPGQMEAFVIGLENSALYQNEGSIAVPLANMRDACRIP